MKNFSDQEPDAPPVDSPDFTLDLARVAVISSGREVSVGCTASVDVEHGNPELLKQLTRLPGRMVRRSVSTTCKRSSIRPRGSGPASKPRLPDRGHPRRRPFSVCPERQRAVPDELLHPEELLRQFYERVGAIRDFKPTGSQIFWEEDLAGSNAGRFLMGAGNTFAGSTIPNCAPHGPGRGGNRRVPPARRLHHGVSRQTRMFFSERAAYTRAWLTHGLLEAGYAGNAKALHLLRGYYDWFNQPVLPSRDAARRHPGRAGHDRQYPREL